MSNVFSEAAKAIKHAWNAANIFVRDCGKVGAFHHEKMEADPKYRAEMRVLEQKLTGCGL